MIEILEPIKVWAFFDTSQIQPYLFFWQGRPIKVDKINLIHTTKNDAAVFYHFSVSSSGNFYQLRFDTGKLRWFLEKVDSEP